MNEKTSRKLSELHCHNVNDDNVNKDDPSSNETKTGLPQITKFYQKFKDLNKLVQDDQDHKQAAVSYMQNTLKLPIVPVPLGLVSHKGDDKTLNLSNYEMGNIQAKALGSAI